MRRFILFFATIIAFVCATAQPLKQDKLFDETYIGVNIGTTGEAHTGDWTGMNAGLRVGKWFTPRVGVELEGTAQFNDFYKTINSHRVGINALVNLNYLTGYNGKRSDCEFVPFIGIGWQRDYCIPYYFNGDGLAGGIGYTHANNLYTKMGLQININFKQDWQFNIIPQVAYNLSGPGKLQYNVNYMDYGIALGVTYNFKNSHGTHYFTACDKKYTQADMDHMNEHINALRAELEECQNRPVVSEVKTIVETKTIPVYVLPNIQFLFNSSKISNTSIASLYEIAELLIANPETKWTVTGYASNEGSEAYNLNLSKERAEAVVEALVDFGVDPSQITVVAGGITEEYPDPCLNRIVKVTQQ